MPEETRAREIVQPVKANLFWEGNCVVTILQKHYRRSGDEESPNGILKQKSRYLLRDAQRCLTQRSLIRSSRRRNRNHKRSFPDPSNNLLRYAATQCRGRPAHDRFVPNRTHRLAISAAPPTQRRKSRRDIAHRHNFDPQPRNSRPIVTRKFARRVAHRH
jgi:hypothetical protein